MNIFFTHTPYHVILSYSIAQEHEDCTLIASGQEPGSELINAIDSHPSCPFDNTIVIEENNYQNRLISAFEQRESIAKIRTFTQTLEQRVHRIYTFHKGSSKTLALFHYIDSQGPGYETGIYVEDGMEAYSSHTFPEKNLLESMMGKILYGKWWYDSTPLYDSKHIQQARATFPESLRKEIQKLPTRAISREPLLQSEMQTIVEGYFETMGVDIPRDTSHIVIAPHSKLIQNNPELAQKLETSISHTGKSSNIAIKYHPRDQSAEYLDIEGYRIPSAIPIETVYLMNEKIASIIGGQSTAVLTAQWLTDAEVFSIYLNWDEADDTINNALSEIGVQPI